MKYCRTPAAAALLAALWAGVLTLPAAAQAPAAAASQPDGAAPRGDVVDVIHGVKVPDPYRVLEDLDDPRTQAWMKAQGARAESQLSRLPGRNALRQRITALAASTGDRVRQVVRMPGDRIYYMKRKAGQSQYVLMQRIGIYGAERALVDPDQMRRERGGVPHAVNWYVPSWDGNVLAYGISAAGSEDTWLVLLDLRTGARIGEPIPRVHEGLVHWAPDSQSLTYNQMRLLSPNAPATDTYKDSVVYHLRVGDKPEEAKPLFGRMNDPDLKLDPLDVGKVWFEPGGRYMMARTTDTTVQQGKLFVAPVSALNTRPVPWRQISGFDDKIIDAQMMGDSVYLLSIKGAPLRRVLKLDLEKPDLAQATVVVPEPVEAVLEGFTTGRGTLYTEQRSGFGVRLMRHAISDHTGAVGPGVDVARDLPGSAHAIDDPAHAYTDALFFQSSWTVPTRIMQAAPGGPAKDTGLRQALMPPNSPDLQVRELEVRTPDGALVPLAIISRKGLPRDSRSPTILVGYGAYGFSFEANFDPRALAWFESGGTIAFANVRGSGARGDAWYRGGYKDTKRNTWEDGIACARVLIQERIASPNTLGVWGTSAGGIFAGRVVTSAPELFSAAVFEVGMMDTVRSEETANGATNISEFGSTKVAAEFPALLEMSTYHQIRDDTAYPAVLLVHGMNDPRVDVWQSAKAAARLQVATSSGKPILLRLDEEAGHGVGSTAEQQNALLADIYAFMLANFDRYGGPAR